MSTMADLCDALVAAITAASGEAAFNRAVTAEVDWAPTQQLEAREQLTIGIVPQDNQGTAAELSASGADEERPQVMVYLQVKLTKVPVQTAEMQPILDLEDRLWREIKTRVSANTFDLLKREGGYDHDRLRDGVYYSETFLTFRKFTE